MSSISYVHTNIIARDWRKLARFYREVLACEPVPPERDIRGNWLSRGTGVPGAAIRGIHLRLPGHGENGPTLEIFSYDQMKEKPPAAANRLGLTHLAFQVTDCRAVREQVLAAGGADLGELVTHAIPGVGRLTFIYMTDPEGNILEIQSHDPG
jgi:predicted enzyme related to lactoylglutathione lyase